MDPAVQATASSPASSSAISARRMLSARRPGPLEEAAAEMGARWVAADSAVPEQFAAVWLDALPPNVVLPEVELSSVDSGPFAPEAFVPEQARRLGRTEG